MIKTLHGMAFTALLAAPLAAAEPPVRDDTGIVRFAEEIPAEGVTDTTVFLRLPHVRQDHNLCVPASAAMVLAYFGDPHPQRELKVLSRGKTWDPNAPFDDFTITWWRDLIVGLETLGYSWREAGYPNNEAGFRNGIEAIRESLGRGHPVMVDVALYRSHTLVIVGLDDERERVYFSDPNLPGPGLRVLTYGQLETIWNGLAYDVNARPALFTRPKTD
ncbi:MAG: C39 family peptidase [Acidobacteriota bacterium]|nr:C39 family peptidase [Acidobacteriota bacterium]